ncbi:MAG: RNA-3-phosphate cyclase [Selenomonadaceae bacterium]|nr:RNA-3-phosphate cyclase [Selenomonadaceae bacterium]
MARAHLRYVGRPLLEVEAELKAAGIPYQTEITRPTRDFFKTEERCLYVVRERVFPDGTLRLAVAARLLASAPELCL